MTAPGGVGAWHGGTGVGFYMGLSCMARRLGFLVRGVQQAGQAGGLWSCKVTGRRLAVLQHRRLRK